MGAQDSLEIYRWNGGVALLSAMFFAHGSLLVLFYLRVTLCHGTS